MQNSSKDYILNNKGRYLKFDLIDNYGGDFIIIKSLIFHVKPIDSIEYKEETKH